MSDDEFRWLEEALVRAGRGISYPETPPLAAQVRTRLAGSSGRRPMGWRWESTPARLAFAVVMAFILALALLLVVPDAREALAQLLGLRTVRILFVTPTPIVQPSATATGTVTPEPTQTGTPTRTPFTLCCATILAEAQARIPFKILLPPSERPTRVYFQEIPNFPDARQVVLRFGDPNAPQWSLYEANTIVYGKLIFMLEKTAQPGTTLAETTVNGQHALWLSGAPHVLVYLDPNGQPIAGTERPVKANTLAWEQGDVTFRLETELSKTEAVKLAESLR